MAALPAQREAEAESDVHPGVRFRLRVFQAGLRGLPYVSPVRMDAVHQKPAVSPLLAPVPMAAARAMKGPAELLRLASPPLPCQQQVYSCAPSVPMGESLGEDQQSPAVPAWEPEPTLP